MGQLLKQFGWLFSVFVAMLMWLTKLTNPGVYLIRQRQKLLHQEAQDTMNQRGNLTQKETTSRPSLIQAIVESPKLPESEKTPNRINSEAQVAITAGTLTTANTITTTIYHILSNPDILAKLTTGIESVYPDLDNPPSLKQLESLPYLTATIHETLRISYGSAHRLQRIFPDRCIQYKDFTIPPGTPVGMSAVHVHDNEDIFPEPYAFRPERWMGEKAPLKYLVAFGRGSRNCVGMELAKAQILTVLAAVIRRL